VPVGAPCGGFFDLSQCLVVTLAYWFRRTLVMRREMKGICRLSDSVTTGSTKEFTFPFVIPLWKRGIEGDSYGDCQIPPPAPLLLKGGKQFSALSNISPLLPWREGKKGRGICSVGVTPHLTSPRQRGEDLLWSC
jgi:hypothetical protein